MAVTINQNVEKSQEVLKNIINAQNNVQQIQKNTTREIQKDAIIVAQEKDLVKMSQETSNAQQKPALSAPSSSFTGTIPQEQESLIAIISLVLVLQAKVSSNNWSTFWKSTTQSMQSEVKFAPIIGKAIEDAANAQSAATQATATQSYITGAISLVAFTGAVVMGGMAYGTEEKGVDDAAALPKQQPSDLESLDNSEELDNLEENDPLKENAKNEIDKENDNFFSKMKKTLTPTKDGLIKFNKVYGHIANASNLAQILSHVGEGFTTGHFQSVAATQQALQGGFQALSQESQQYAQFYGKAFGLNQSLADTANRGVQSAMDIYKSAVDQITNTVTSMFRG